MTINRYDKNNNPLPPDYQLDELPEELYEFLSEVYARRIKELETLGTST